MYKLRKYKGSKLQFVLAFIFTFVVQVSSNSCDTNYTADLEEIVTCTDFIFDNITITVLTNDLVRDYKRILIIRESNINKLPLDTTLKPLINFTIAFFSSARINEIEHLAFSIMPNLTELYLSDNSIKVIEPGIFDYLEKLNILDLSKNRIKTIEEHSFSNSSIVTLNLTSNDLSTWDGILSMKKIEVLDFSKNSLSSFSLEQMPSTMKVLNLDNNRIAKFVGTGNKTKALELLSLDLSENMISDLDPLPLRNLMNLERLFLQKNNISTFPVGYFSDLIHLRYLDASHNNIKVMQSGLFDTFSNLKNLILSYNHVMALENEHFRYLYELNQLYVDNNEMSILNLTVIIKPARHLKYVSLDSNAFSCDYLSGLIQAMLDSGIDVARGKHFESNNINGNTCHKQPSGGSSDFYKSNRLTIILSVLAGVVIILLIPWCVKYYKYSRSRRSLLEDIEIVTYTS